MTAIVQVASGASEAPQVFVCVKAGWPEVGSLLMLMPSMVNARVPELVKVALIGLPEAVRFSDAGLRYAGPAFASRPTPVIRTEIMGFAEVLLTVR